MQFYLRSELASITRPVQELRHFEKIQLEPGESREVIWRITADDLSILDENFKHMIEPGTFRIGVGTSSRAQDQQFVTLSAHL